MKFSVKYEIIKLRIASQDHCRKGDCRMNNETTCGLKNSYIEAYLGEREASRCLHEWKGSELRFDPFAFLFSFFYFFRKKMYREFALFLTVSAILPLAVGLITGIISVRSEWRYKDAEFSAVFDELTEPPIVYYHENFSGCFREPGGLSIYNNHSFRSHAARLGTLTLINIFCGLNFGRMYKRKTEKEIKKQISLIRTDDEAVRENILRKAGMELNRSNIGNVFAFLLWSAFVLVSFLPAAYGLIVSYFLVY